MNFVKITSTAPVADFLAEVLTTHLSQGQRVLWLVCGGSSIPIAAAVSRRLAGASLGRLTVTLTDERYGEVGHPDSNCRALEEAGFRLAGAQLRPVLTGGSLPATAGQFAELLRAELAAADYRLGFFGIGPDGHTAGLLPGSPGLSTTALAAGYDAGQFRRLTMTPPAIRQLDEAVVYAVGEAKWPVLEGLNQDHELGQQPAQVLKSVPRLTIFNDYKGD